MADQAATAYEFETFLLDALKRVLFRGDEPVPLPPKVFDLLLLLVHNHGRLVKKDELMNAMWPDLAVEECNLTQNVFQLRKVLGESAHDHKFIVTVPGQGYRFVAEVRAVGQPGGEPPSGPARMGGPIAVLPFQMLGGGPGDEYLGLAIADALITRLGAIRDLTVRPTGSVLRYGKTVPDPLGAGRELGVDTLVHGAVHRSGERLRITVQIVNVPSTSVVWADVIDQQFTDVFAAQDALCERIARALTLRLTGEERRQFAKRYTESPAAYDAYLKGRYLWNKRTAEGFHKAIECFERAGAQDPGYGLAYAGLADCHNLLACYSVVAPGDAWPRARAAAERALGIDERLAEAHASVALVRMGYEWDWDAAERECLRALELKPGYATAGDYMAEWLCAQGRPTEALAEIRQAQHLEPLSLIINRDVGVHLYFARRYDEAIDHLRDTLELGPDFALAHWSLAWAYERKGLYRQAIDEIQAAISLVGPTTQFLAELGHACATSGDHERAGRVLAEMTATAQRGYVSPYHFALVWLGLGDHGRALDWLEQACQSRVWEAVYLGVEPKLDALRGVPRFRSLLRRVGLAPQKEYAVEPRARM